MSGSIGHFQYETYGGLATNYYKANFVPDENCTFAFMGWGLGTPTFFFGCPTGTANIDYNGEAGHDGYDTPFQYTVSTDNTIYKSDLLTFLDNCKYRIVDIDHKLTEEKFNLLKQGVADWADANSFSYNVGSQSVGINIYSGYFKSITGFGSDKLVINGFEARSQELIQFCNVDKNVDSYLIDAYLYQQKQSSVVNYSDSALEFIAFDSIQKAIEEEFITDPDLLEFFEDIDWTEIQETRVDWVVNVDGVKNPDITITWSAPGIEAGDFDSGTAVVNMSVYDVGFHDWSNYGTFTYNKKVIKTTWSKMAEFASVPDFTKILSNITSLTAKIRLQFHLTYFLEGVQYETSLATAYIGYDGTTEGRIETPRDGSTITFTHTSTDEFIEEFVDDITDSIDNPDGTSESSKQQTYSGIGVMTKTYVMTKSRLQQLGRFLWGHDFFDFIQDLNASPIENIVSIKMLPFTIAGGTDEEIVLGNVGTGVLGKPVDIDYNCKHVINSGGTTIEKKYPASANFLNSKPFTKLSIFLPYIGFKELDPDVFLDKKLLVEYIADIITGSCVAVIYANNVPICQYSGLIGLDVPISATNRAQVEMGIISGVGQTVMGLSSGNIGGMASGAMSILSNSFHTETRGTASPSCDSFITHDVFYILENAEVQYPSRYNHLHGRPLNLSKTLRNVSGFTVCENVDVSGIQGATKEELENIKDMLEKGVYL